MSDIESNHVLLILTQIIKFDYLESHAVDMVVHFKVPTASIDKATSNVQPNDAFAYKPISRRGWPAALNVTGTARYCIFIKR